GEQRLGHSCLSATEIRRSADPQCALPHEPGSLFISGSRTVPQRLRLFGPLRLSCCWPRLMVARGCSYRCGDVSYHCGHHWKVSNCADLPWPQIANRGRPGGFGGRHAPERGNTFLVTRFHVCNLE